MLTLTNAAKEAIRECFPEKTVLRLDISPRGCGAPVVTVRSDQPLPSDMFFETDGRTLCVDAALCQHAQSIDLDCLNGRFTASLAVPITVSGCGECPASPLRGGRCGIIDGMNF